MAAAVPPPPALAAEAEATTTPASVRRQKLNKALQWAKKYLLDNSLTIFFALATIVALAAPAVGRALSKPQVAGVRVVSFVLMFFIFICSGLSLKTRELKAAFGRRAILGTAWGLAAICALTPTLGFAVRHIVLAPPEYITGLVIMLAAPTTLGVGISMAQRCRGNVGLAIALTVISNGVGVAVMPLWLGTLLRGAGGEGGGAGQAMARPMPLLIAKLAVSNLLPTVLGKLLREVSPKKVAPWADRNKAWLGMFSNWCLAVIILQSLSGARDELLGTPLGTFCVVLLLGLGYHALFLAVNAAALWLLRVPPPEASASLILGSQKSAPVALTAIEFITSDLAVQGLLAVPCVIGQLGQVFMGHPLTVLLEKSNARYYAAEKAAEAGKKAAAGAADGADAEAPAVGADGAVLNGGKGGAGDGDVTVAEVVPAATAAAAAAAAAAEEAARRG